ncbi:MAG TPA: NAD(P)-dependent oxidoreductase, partial [Chitinophagaceae bacterium]|nr:NAD(P)-dependent oxidoreductase [Chitinophagaceae bacterium]
MNKGLKEMSRTQEKQGNDLFPVFLKLEHLRLLIVGGGKVGLEKLNAVIQNSPLTQIKLVSPEINPEISQLAEKHPTLTLHLRPYETTDLDDCDIAIVAVNNKILSESIHAESRQKHKLVNVADTPELCDFYLSSIVKKGNLKIAISTNGKSPTIAKRLKETFSEVLPGELDEILDNMYKIRNRLNGNFEHKVKKLNELTRVLVQKEQVREKEIRWRKIATYSLAVFALMLIGHFIFSYLPLASLADETVKWYQTLDKNFHWMVLAGFCAQMVDGATSMGYGVTSSIILQSAHVSPAAISGGIHTAEMFTSGASGYSHYKFGNVNKKLFKALV